MERVEAPDKPKVEAVEILDLYDACCYIEKDLDHPGFREQFMTCVVYPDMDGKQDFWEWWPSNEASEEILSKLPKERREKHLKRHRLSSIMKEAFGIERSIVFRC